MQTSLFNTAQRVIKQVLDWLTTTVDTDFVNRYNDMYQYGIVTNLLNNFTIVGKDLDPTLLDFFHVEVQTGVAYMVGERIALIDSPLITYNASNPSITTNDGTGNLISTPQSTGSYNIPLTAGSLNYLYIAYLSVIDPTQFTLNKVTNAKQFYKQEDGYQIVVNTTGVNPNPALYLFLGQINLTGGNQAVAANISQVGRVFFQTQFRRIAVQTNNSGHTDVPTSYGYSQTIFVDDHVKAIGSGTPSPTNPHALTLGDLGQTPNQTVNFHRINEHTNGLIAGTTAVPDPISSAMYCELVVVSPGSDYILVQALQLGEVAVVNGIAYDYTEFSTNVALPFINVLDVTSEVEFSITSVTDATHLVVSSTAGLTNGDLITQAVVSGSTVTFVSTTITTVTDGTHLVVGSTAGFHTAGGVPAGSWNIYFNQPTSFIQMTTSSIASDETKLWLSTVTWDGSAILSSLLDRRIFGTSHVSQRWVTSARPPAPIAGMFGFNLDSSQMEFYNGSTWITL